MTARPSPRRGFALLVTLVLVAFLVLLLVGLATFTRVETQVASNSQQQAQARQNAIMALNIAVGELQKYTGPDQRTTARSDMDAALANTTIQSGRWLGAYGSGAEADYEMQPSAVSPAIVAASDGQSSQAKLLNWLVSGNELTAFNPGTDVGAKGQISIPPAQFDFSPTGAVAGLGASSTALSDITVADRTNIPRPARLLVGKNTVFDKATSTGAVSDFVVAPLRDIDATAPGQGPAPVTVGRYAWWIGDEGAKARANLPMAAATTANEAFSSARRAGVELMDGVNPTGTTTLDPAHMLDPSGGKQTYNPSSTTLGQVITPAQLSMLGTTPTASAALRALAGYRYHDLTLESFSVLSDTYAGGLKKDLSAVLANGASSPLDTDFLFKTETNSGTTTHDFGAPTWGQLRSYVRATSNGTSIAPQLPTMTNVAGRPVPTGTSNGIAPVMTYATLGFCYGVPQNVVGDFDAVNNPIRLAIFPVVVLWNPYNTRLAGATYQVGIRKQGDARFELQSLDTSVTGATWTVLDRVNLDSNVYRFKIDVPDIPAGQSYVFTLGSSGGAFTANSNTNRLALGFRPGNHAIIAPSAAFASTMVITKTGLRYRVGVNGDSTPDSGQPVPVTFTADSIPNFGRGTPALAYLAAENASPPDNDLPYNGTTFNSWQFYQSIGALSTSNSSSPYGSNPGYSMRQGIHGLFRDEGPIDMIAEPTFRLSIRARFAESNTRWIAQANPRAFMINRTTRSGVANWTLQPGSHATWPNDLAVFGDRANSGLNLANPTGPTDLALFELRPDTQPLLSIGQLQHANLSWISNYPAYAIGNSLADPNFSANQDNDLHVTPAEPEQVFRLPLANYTAFDVTVAKRSTAYYDASWLLNRALWDRYFVSTVPHAGTAAAGDLPITEVPRILRNPRHVRYGSPTDPALLSAERAATGLLLAGGFNINSTSEQAWRAVLGGVNRLDYDPVARNNNGPELRSALSRFSHPLANDQWNGYRALTEDQIATLAADIVAEIRRRGVSISLADFINRRLTHARSGATDPFPVADDADGRQDKRLKGAIQAALDRTASGAGASNAAATAPFSSNQVTMGVNWPNGTTYQNPFRVGGTAPRAPYGSASAFAPQFLTQADILSTIGAGLAGRSDTFTIRTYGEVVNPVDSTITARAWCEAVVQRTPEYLDNTAATGDPDPEKIPTATVNRTMGRRYKIVSFRWLSAEDI